jgi:uncharacterized protein DUF4350
MNKPWVDRLLTPRVLGPVLGALLVVAVLFFAPTPAGFIDRSGPLTTTSTTPSGARGLYELMSRLGWPVVRRHIAFDGRLDSTAVYLVLDPPTPPSEGEAHALLDAVRRGAGLVYVLQDGAALADSLHVKPEPRGGTMNTAQAGVGRPRCLTTDPGSPAITWFDGRVHLYGLAATRAWPSETTFVTVRDADSAKTVPAAIGFQLGAGRAVVLSDPDMLRNDVIRVCLWGLGVQAVRMIHYAAAERRRPLVFDEFHFAAARQADWMAASWAFLTDTSPGRTTLQIVAAGLVLLVVAAWRPVAPVARARIERRSALEHAEALARAFARVGATRIATRRLVRGLRRRHAVAAWQGTDEAFLHAVAAHHPGAQADVATILDAVARRVTPAELLTVGHAVDHIDQVLSS